jgi:hypothetical protein
MRKIWDMLKKHWRADFDPKYYLSVVLFLAVSLSINYYLGLENQIIDRHPNKSLRILWYFLLYGAAYYGAFLLMVYFKKRTEILKSWSFWLLTLMGLLLLSLDSGFPYMPNILHLFEPNAALYRWVFSIGNNITGFLVVSTPLIILNVLTNPSNKLNGLGSPGFDARPYLTMLLIILPVIAIASFENSFVAYYPTYKSNLVAETLGWPQWAPMILYEFVYGIDFFNTEFLFRGFMVIGLAHILGKDAIVPMVTTYCFLHFGKPAGEAISSIVGGYILGVIAFYSRSIWGGVIVHIGLAWMMELAAYLQKVY